MQNYFDYGQVRSCGCEWSDPLNQQLGGRQSNLLAALNMKYNILNTKYTTYTKYTFPYDEYNISKTKDTILKTTSQPKYEIIHISKLFFLQMFSNPQEKHIEWHQLNQQIKRKLKKKVAVGLS